MKIVIKIFIVLITIVFVVSLASLVYIQKGIETPHDVRNDARKEFVVQKGESVQQIAENLQKEDLINNATFFKFYVWKENLADKLQAGKYELSSSMSIPDIVNLFTGGKVKPNEIKITIPEGFLNKEIDKKLYENNLIAAGEFIKFDKENSLDLSKYEFLKDKPDDVGLEGYYFPDTYIYYKDATIEDVVKKMLDNFDDKLTMDLREEIERQNKSIFETIILASIIEKEAGLAEDMGKVAGVFQNRLNSGYPLESCATINYVTGENKRQLDDKDLKIDSPYNTYKYLGLPPTPISNPGINAIKAAIYPEKTDYFYFLTKGNKETVFSKTYEEHLVNKNKYLN